MNQKKSNSKKWQRTSTVLTAVIALSVLIVGIGILPVNVSADIATVQRYLPDNVWTSETFTVSLTQSEFFLNSGTVWEELPEGFEYVNGSYTGGGEVEWYASNRTLKVQFRTEYTIEYNVTASSFGQTAEFSGIYHAFVQGCVIEEWGNVTGDTKVIVKKSDPDPPVISNVASSSITTNSATITWDTDEISDSLVKYGTAPGDYTMEKDNTAYVTDHSIDITGLTVDTPYYYVVNSTDPSGNSAESTEYSFTTSAVPDLIVTNITLNCDYLFANESNTVNATIKNNGTAAADPFNVCFDIDGFSEEVRVAGLAAGASEEVSVTDPTSRNAGKVVTITVIADCDGEIGEANEANNESSISETVVNNGYKGKRYTGGDDINTLQTHTLNGSVLYSVGDSYYLSGYNASWDTYRANWTASNLPVPGDATIEKARLYVIYTWDKVQGMPDNVIMEFNDKVITSAAFYTDRKGYGTSDYPYGMLAYDVTGDFNKSGNSAVLDNLNPVAGNPSMRGMLLVVIYKHDGEAKRKIIMNEGFDLLYGGASKCTTPEEATAFAPFAGEIEDAVSARLITVAPGAGPDEGELIFNGQVWNNVWNFAGATQIGIDDRDVTADIEEENNEAEFQSSEDYMEASNAILVVKEKPHIEQYNYTIYFATGYNMISLPVNDTSVTSASLLIDKIGANCMEISKWDKNTQTWKAYAAGQPPIFDFEVIGGEGYFIRMSGLANVTFTGKGWESPFTISLVLGYNTIGMPVNDTSVTKASTLIDKIGACCIEVSKWDKGTQTWKAYAAGQPPIFDFDIHGEDGCFVSMECSADVTFEGKPWSN